MEKLEKLKTAIVDYGRGNLFSVKNACDRVGLEACITSERNKIIEADAVILPGVGAFGDAIDSLKRLDLITVLQDVSASSKPFLGICLGMQLLMEESLEFGHYNGLGIIKGSVIGFDASLGKCAKRFKVPHVGWNRVNKVKSYAFEDTWKNSLLGGLVDGEFMYFVHSFYVVPEDSGCVLSVSQYGDVEFCSSLQVRNIFACQFHPERSGSKGLRIYRNLASFVRKSK